ncbi:alpha/beta hydrolase [Mycobacterium sp. NPDC051804]|uniref:alpha/beta hydrolase n=1 Tax=Mycobacterium sp. NPDC051804 TaxID=3364295 RepID=UPI0037ADE63B
MSRDQLVELQRREFRHNLVTDFMFGSRASGVSIEDRAIDGPGGDLPLRIYRTNASDTPLVVFFHGGGFVLGSLGANDAHCSRVSAATGAVVVSVGYRLAPLNPFPAAVDDSYAALVWAVEHADELGADAQRLGVMGHSAGGNLAAVMCLLARDRSGPTIRHQALVYPFIDLSSAATRRDVNSPILPTAELKSYREHYFFGHQPEPADDPRASPILAESHRGLPPALIQVAQQDPLREDGQRYADALRGAGVPVRITEYAGMPHGFLAYPRFCKAAPVALAELSAELKSALSG